MAQENVYVVQTPYNISYKKCCIIKTTFKQESIESAIKWLSLFCRTDIFSSNKIWIEDSNGNVLLNGRQTKKEASKLNPKKHKP